MTSKVNYDDIIAVRRSELWEMRKSPAHYRWVVDHPEEPTAALLFGTAAHKYILEPEKFDETHIIAPKVDRRTKAGKEELAKFLEEADGKMAVSIDDMEKIIAMSNAIDENPTAKQLLRTGIHEKPIEWMDGETKLNCKCRPDCLTTYKGQKYIVDYKTTKSCAGYEFERSCRKYGYKLQAGMYSEGVFHETLDEYGFAFVAQEKDPPYAVRVYFCDPGFVDEGIDLFHDLIRKLNECIRTDDWSGYEDTEVYGDE